MQLRTKTILFLGVIFLSLAVLAVVYLESSVRSSFRDEITNNLRITAEEKEGIYFAFIEGLKVRTIDWSSDSYIKGLAEKIVDPKLSDANKKSTAKTLGVYLREKKMKYDPTVLIVDILDEHGVVIASSRENRIGTDEHKEEVQHGSHHFSKTISAGFDEAFSRSVVFEDDETMDPMFHLTTRLFSTNLNGKGKFTPLPAVMFVHFVSLPQLNSLLSGKPKTLGEQAVTSQGFIQSYKTSETYLVNFDHILVTPTRSIKSVVEKNIINTKPVDECFKNGKEVVTEYENYQGVMVVGASMCLQGDGLVLINEIEVSEAYALFNNLVQKTIAAGTIVFVLILAVASFVTRRVLGRFSLVVSAAEGVSRGNFATRVPHAGDDEIGYLARTFNVMLDTITAVQSKLKISEEDIRKKAELLEADVLEHQSQEKFLEQSKRATLNLLDDAWQVKERLQVESNRLQTIISSIGDGLILIDGGYRIALVNPSASEIFGFSEEELLGKDLRSVMKLWKKRTTEVPPAEWPIEEMFLTKAVVVTDLEDDLFLTTEKRAVHLPVTFSVAPLGSGLAGGVIVIRDVTEDRALDEAKSGFISVASHQLRTPLTSIRWYSEMLLSEDAGALNESQKDFMKEIHGGAERLYQTVDLLLGISRVESGKIKTDREPIDLGLFTAEITKELGSQMDEKDLVTNVVPPQRDHVIVWLDPLTLRQVILNLLSNAIRYTNNKGIIDVKWWVDDEKKEEVVYMVHDNGIGIPESQRPRIFSKFFRAENARAQVPDGSGLGLALVKDLVESWGGRVWFETEEGKGTTFYFTVPLLSPTSSEQSDTQKNDAA